MASQHDGVWWDRAPDGNILLWNGQQWVVWEPTDAGPQPPQALVRPVPPVPPQPSPSATQPPTRRLGSGAIVLIALGGGFAGLILFAALAAALLPEATGPSRGSTSEPIQVVAREDDTADSPSPHSTSPAPRPDEGLRADSEEDSADDRTALLEYEVARRKDVSYDFGNGDAAQRLVLQVEIPQWPVTKAELEALAQQLLEEERGNGWQAISIAMGADRDETIPAYAMFEWAPGGDWGQASEGDPETWTGYEFAITWGAKMADPEEAECEKPPPIAFQYNRELWRAPASMSEKKIIAEIAARHDDSPAHVRKLLEDVLEWEFC